MATILIVDDRPVNRQYLVTLLGCCGHRMLEASDGAEALALARTERPDLIITDILIPTKDGAELVQAMHTDPALAAVPVIFCSASYRDNEARTVAAECGASIVLSKPADAEDVLHAVKQVLGRRAAYAEVPAGAEPPRVDLGQVTDALGERVLEQQRCASRLAVIIEPGLDLTGERESSRLLQQFCKEARDIVTGRFVSVGLLSEDGRTLTEVCNEGVSTEDAVRLPAVVPVSGKLGELVGDGKPRRLSGTLEASDLGLPGVHGALSSFLGVVVATARRTYGWLCFCNKVGATEFTDEDERLAVTLAAQLAVAYENLLLHAKAEQDAEVLRLQAAALAATANAIMITDRQGTIVWANPAAARLTGHRAEELLGKNPRLLKSGQQDAAFYRQMWKTIVAGEVWSAELTNRRRDGSLYTEEMTITPVRDARDDITHFIAIKQDISARKRAEAGLRDSEERFRQLAENIGGVFWLSDVATGQVFYVSPAYEAIWGRTCQSFYENPMSFVDGIHPEDREGVLSALAQQALVGELQKEYRVVRPDGTVRHIWDQGFPIPNASGETYRVAGIAQDITERKRVEGALESREKELRLIMNAAPALIAYVDAEYRYRRVNKSYERWFGRTAEQVHGRHVREVLGEAAWEAGRPEMERALAGEAVTYERQFPYEGGGPRWVYATYTPDRDSTGRVQGFVAHVVDIGELKQAEGEIQKLNAELEERVRQRTAELEAANKELEAFSYSVSHDLRAPLRGIDGWASALAEDCADKLDAQGREYLARVCAEAQRMGTLIDDLLELSRVSRAEMRQNPVDLSALARGILADLRQHDLERQVETVVAPGLEAVGDPQLLRLVLENLLGNAWKFTAKRGQARIEFGVVAAAVGGRKAPNPAAETAATTPTETVCFVRDNGAGFDMAYAHKLFAPFQRLHTQRDFAGTGIGLATVQRIIRRHGGDVYAEGAPDQGATFYFTLRSQRGKNPEHRSRDSIDRRQPQRH